MYDSVELTPDRCLAAGPQKVSVAVSGAVVAGVALGVATQILQGLLPGSWGVLANSGVTWALFAFAIGLLLPSPRSAAVGGAIALVAASVSYYVAVDWFEGISSEPRGAIVWSAAGIVAGSAFGFAGFLARRSSRHRWSAWALVAGVLFGEGIHLTWYVGNDALRPAGIAELGVAAILSAIIVAACVRRTAPGLVAAITVAAALATVLAGRLVDGALSA